MAREPEKPDASSFPSPDRVWAEQLAAGMALFIGLLIFMALFHPGSLSVGAEVLGPNDISAYGWMSVLGVFLQIVIHEAGTLVVAWRMGLPLRFRFFGLGANAAAILGDLPRRANVDAAVGMAGPLTGSAVSVALALVYHFTNNPLFLGMACVGYFYNLFTLIPILELEGGWIAGAIAPQWWLFGLVACSLELRNNFNLVLLGVVSFAVPRFILLLRARMPRTDLECSRKQWLLTNLGYFVLVVALAWLSSKTFEVLPGLVREAMGD